jgi:hypothetical protein
MANVYRQPNSVEEYLNDSRTGHTAPAHVSHGMRHDRCDREGQTILATGAVNNVGRVSCNIENSLLDDHFGGAHDNAEHSIRGTARAVDDVGHRGTRRRAVDELHPDEVSFVNGFIRVGRF